MRADDERVENFCALKGRKEAALFEKSAQKLLLCWAMGVVADNAHGPN
jgi:hypothetical protein